MGTHFSIIGARGFVGQNLVDHLRRQGHEVTTLDRCDSGETCDLGHVIDCGGLTADFRTRKDEIFPAHVCRVDAFLKNSRFLSYLYLSSTRVYKNRADTREDSALEVRPAEFDDSYNISKIAGEAVCLIEDNPAVRVARLSNVLGRNPDTSVFLMSLIDAAKRTGRIELGESLDSEKDYVDIADVCSYLERIALGGQHRLYNVAYGENRSHRRLLEQLAHHHKFNISAPECPTRVFPLVSTERLVAEFGRPQISPEASIDGLMVETVPDKASRDTSVDAK